MRWPSVAGWCSSPDAPVTALALQAPPAFTAFQMSHPVPVVWHFAHKTTFPSGLTATFRSSRASVVNVVPSAISCTTISGVIEDAWKPKSCQATVLPPIAACLRFAVDDGASSTADAPVAVS